MLVLSRKAGQKIIINEKITITVVRVAQGSVRIGVDAPDDCTIVREEILDAPVSRDVPRNGNQNGNQNGRQNANQDAKQTVPENDYVRTD